MKKVSEEASNLNFKEKMQKLATFSCHYLISKLIPLMFSKEKMWRRNVKKVIRYHTPNKVTDIEAYSHRMLK